MLPATLPPATLPPQTSSEPLPSITREPVKRTTKKAEPPASAPKQNLADVVSAWSDN